MYPRAPASLLLRAAVKDETYSNELRERAMEAARVSLGSRWTSAHEAIIIYASRFLYLLCAALRRGISPGVEHTGLLPVLSRERDGQRWTLPLNVASLAAIVLIESFQRPLLGRLSRRFFSGADSGLLHRGLKEALFCAFLLWEQTLTLSDVLLRVRYLLIRRSAASRRQSTLFLGVVATLTRLVALYRFAQARRRDSEAGSAVSDVNNADTEEERPDDGGPQCGLCLGCCVAPTATECGHIYCWSCVANCLNEGQQRCPLCRGLIRRSGLVALQN